jgi:hypothetical protein
MKGTTTFTTREAEVIRRLLRLKVTVARPQQRAIRDIIRYLGFYITDFKTAPAWQHFTDEDFAALIARGVITVGA